VDDDRWGEPVYVKPADGDKPDARSSLQFEQKMLLTRIDSERAHIAAGTQGPDPVPPEEVLAWCEERLRVIEHRLQLLDRERQEDPDR
jgi:hypothetical protein